MSYKRRFERTVQAKYHGKIHVSCSVGDNNQNPRVSVEFNGEHKSRVFNGTGSFDIYDYAEEDVTVQVDVDTDKFDSSIDKCNDHVKGLTESVGAMNAAQCVAIKDNADKVSQTIINGFFHTVRADLSTRRAELEQAIDARLILLKQQADTLREKQKTMAEDYARTTARYQKLFSDLNNELSVRIHEIDQPVFDLVNEVDIQNDRMLHTDMIQTVVTASKESSVIQAQITAATVKRHALEAMEQAQLFLISKYSSEKTIQETCIDRYGNDSYMIPVCYMRTESENRHIERKCYMPDYYSRTNESLTQTLCNSLENVNIETSCDNDREQIKSYVQSEIATNVTGDDEHFQRVRALINKMLND